MAMLNEYCLQHIFDFRTPLEWAQVSQVIVCQFCKTAAKKQYIKKVCIKNCSTSHQDIVAGTIEDLSLHFSDIDEFQSFRQYFPKLKKLSLSIIDPSLANNVDRKRHAYYNCKPHEVLRGITNLSELEEFRFFFKYDGYRIESQDSFLDELARSCPNLKAVTLFGLQMIHGNSLHSLMSLPNLQDLDVDSVSGFSSSVLPEMKNLTNCRIYFCGSLFKTSSICNAVKKMPKLLNLIIDNVAGDQTFRITCAAIVAAVAQKKDVIITKQYLDMEVYKGQRLKITRKNYQKASDLDDEQRQALTMMISSQYETYFDDVSEFVNKNVEHHQAFIIEFGEN